MLRLRGGCHAALTTLVALAPSLSASILAAVGTAETDATIVAAIAAPAGIATLSNLAALAAPWSAVATLAATAAPGFACVGDRRLGRLSQRIRRRGSTHLRHAGHHRHRSAVLQSGRRSLLALLGPRLRRC